MSCFFACFRAKNGEDKREGYFPRVAPPKSEDFAPPKKRLASILSEGDNNISQNVTSTMRSYHSPPFKDAVVSSHTSELVDCNVVDYGTCNELRDKGQASLNCKKLFASIHTDAAVPSTSGPMVSEGNADDSCYMPDEVQSSAVPHETPLEIDRNSSKMLNILPNQGKNQSYVIPNEKSPSSRTFDEDRSITGAIDVSWIDVQGVPKWWDGNGIPNSTHKYKEDQKVCWHATPFEERIEKALSKEIFFPKRNLYQQMADLDDTEHVA